MDDIFNLGHARELEAQAKTIRRQAKEFWSIIDAHASEVLEHLGAKNPLGDIADKYGITVDSLIEYISSDEQISYYRRKHTAYDGLNSIGGYAD